MSDMFTWPEALHMLITFLLALCVIAQALALVLSYYRYLRRYSRIFENLLELNVLIQVFICTLLHGQVLLNYELGMMTPTGFVFLRYAAFAFALLFAFIVMVTIRKPRPLSVVIASGLTLPIMGTVSGNAFAYIYLAAMIFWLLRSVHICILRAREIRTNLSVLSIKNSIDTLHAGVLFGETDGFILLSNRQMQRLMVVITGKVRRNGWHFYEQLLGGNVQPGCQTAEFEDQIVCLLPDGSAWMFNKIDMYIRGKTYIQFTASDITQRWDLTAQLQRQEDLLKQRSDELNDTIANIHILSRQRETQKAKMRAHDILGQRLTLLLRTIRSEDKLGYDVLESLSQGLMEDLKTRQKVPSPQDELDSLQQAFASIGVKIDISGMLPENDVKGRLFVDIMRESVTNAVRHGFATKISIEINNTDGDYRLMVTNNGHPPNGPITEGGGLGGMRRKVEPHGGALNVTIHPKFVLTVDLTGEDSNE